MAKQSKKSNGANVGFEETLWSAADKMRNNMDPAEYKHVVLGLIFLKYISDSFEEVYKSIKADADYYDGQEEDKDAYLAEGVFWVPQGARWEYLKANAKKPEIGKLLDDAMISIEKDNPRLKGILAKNYARSDLDKHRLGELIDLIGTIGLGDEASRSKDVLGRVYEYFLGRFASAEGKGGGEFFTPQSVVKLLVEMLEPYKGRIYDPCCGSGGMFVQSEKFVEAHGGNTHDLAIYGQESNPTTWRLCKMNLAIRGIEGNLGSSNADTFHNDLHKDLKADYILANPPFNISDWGGERLKDDVRWKYGVPPAGNANYGWIQHMIHHLAPNGTAGFVMHNGAATNEGAEAEIRKSLVDNDLIEAMVLLPTQLFYNVSLPVNLWFISRNKKEGRNFRDRKEEVLMIDASSLGAMETSIHRVMTDDDIQRIASVYHSWKSKDFDGKLDESGFCTSVKVSDIKSKNYILAPNRYVGLGSSIHDKKDPSLILREVTSDIQRLTTRTDFLKASHPKSTEALLSQEEDSWDKKRLIDLVEEVTGGEWGQVEAKDGYVECKVVRGTDIPNIPLFKIAKLPTRFVKRQKVEDKAAQVDDLIVEISGGSKDQPTGRCLLITEDFLSLVNKPVLYSNFTKRLRIKKDLVDPQWVYWMWRILYQKGLTTRFENQPSGIKNFQMDEFLNNVEIPIPSTGVQKELVAFLRSLESAKVSASTLAYRLENLIDGVANEIEKVPDTDSN